MKPIQGKPRTFNNHRLKALGFDHIISKDPREWNRAEMAAFLLTEIAGCGCCGMEWIESDRLEVEKLLEYIGFNPGGPL